MNGSDKLEIQPTLPRTARICRRRDVSERDALRAEGSREFLSWKTPRSRCKSSIGFTLIELLVVISIIAVLAGLSVGVASYAKRKRDESIIRAELYKLATAIDAYYAAFGQYPPDNVVSKSPLVVNPAINQLYYELSGTIVDNNARTFRVEDGSAALPLADVQSTFNVDGFVNSKPDPKDLRRLPIRFNAKHHATLTNSVEVLVVPVAWPLGLPSLDWPTPVRGLNPWRYVSSSPTNNPTSYDLWADYVDGKKIKTICNWTKEILERPLP